MAREFVDENPDEVAQFNDLVAGFGTRDGGGLPLGNVQDHAANRLTVCHAIIEGSRLLATCGQLAAGYDGIPPFYEFSIGGAVPQDRPGTTDYPAAHLAPGTVKLGDPGSARRPDNLYDLFADGITRSYMHNLFARTELVHRLTNYVDSICERKRTRDGMAEALVESCTLAARNYRVSTVEVLHDELIPKFQRVARDRLAVVTTSLSSAPSELLETSPLLDHRGQPYRAAERPTDTRIHSPSPAAWVANRQAVLQILGTYAGINEPKMPDIRRTLDQFRALRANEDRARRR
jgi:hypothetical protein